MMECLGYSSEGLLSEAQRRQAEYDMGDSEGMSPSALQRVFAYTDTVEGPGPAEEEIQLYAAEDDACFPKADAQIPDEADEVRKVLAEKVSAAATMGAPPEVTMALTALLDRYADVFRLRLGRDPPVDMPPMVIRLKEGAVPPGIGNYRMTVDVRGPNTGFGMILHELKRW
ncbi:hypothetical protein ATCC90586_010197 [Pythium insidiosum]|nr:hypothetical protein ATCC90586_010197 [Pythium insidiosum]